MDEVSFRNLVVVMAAAVAAPLVARLVPKIKLPGPVVELLIGVAIGPAALKWAEPGPSVMVISTLGLAYLLFLAGLEIDVEQVRGPLYRLAGAGFVCSLAVALVFSYGLEAAGLVDSPWFAAILLSATSLALIVPVLKESGQLEAPLGKLSFGEASVAEFATVLMLSALFSKASTSSGARVALAVTFVVLVLGFAWTFKRVSRSARLAGAVAKLEDGTSQIRVRATMLIVIGFVVIAEKTGLEAILGALIAGALLSMLDGGYLRTHEAFRSKLDAIGFGFLIPVFFVASGMQLDLDALWASPSRLILIPVVLVALLAVRSVVIVIYRRALSPREAVVAWILQSTLSLPFVVTATTIGRQLDLVGPATTAALVAAAVVSGLVFPALALALIPRQDDAPEDDAPEEDVVVDVVDP